jgi:hypothetical protein
VCWEQQGRMHLAPLDSCWREGAGSLAASVMCWCVPAVVTGACRWVLLLWQGVGAAQFE